MQTNTIIQFIKAYVKSMRLYYSFITGIAGWIGVSYYQYIATHIGERGTSSLVRTIETEASPTRKIVILMILFLGWGINQIYNDYLGRKEDRINAPERPMVTGELNPKAALIVSTSLLILSALITYFYLEPIALIPLFAGISLNFLYEYAKGHGILGNIIFGIMISMCALFGLFASGPMDLFFTKSRYSGLLFVTILNGLMTYYTYFKDFKGDKEAGKNTIIVKFGIERNRTIAILSSFLPSILFFIAYYGFGAFEIELNSTFKTLGILTIFLQVWTGALYYKNPVGEMTYYSLVTNFRACVCGQTTIIALFNPDLGLMLFLMSYVFIGFLFNLHTNIKA